MVKITIDECVYNVHPIYNLYAGSKDGTLINIIKQKPIQGNKQNMGYLCCYVRRHGQSGQKRYCVHRFIWECFNGVIPDNKVIDHINKDKQDNRLCNLQLMTQQENCKKAAKDRDYTFASYNHKNKKCVKAINCKTNEISYYNSLYSVNQHLGINAGVVKMVCEKLNNCKSGISKVDGNKYKFEYIKLEDMPDNYKKSANTRAKRNNSI